MAQNAMVWESGLGPLVDSIMEHDRFKRQSAECPHQAFNGPVLKEVM